MDPRELLLSTDFLRVLPEDVIARLESACVRKRVADGEAVLRRGAKPDALYGVVHGELRVLARSSRGRELVVTLLGPGQWFGEISLLDGLPRTHDVVARGDAEVLVLPGRDFRALLDDDPRLYAHFVALLCRKLRLTFALLEDSVMLSLPGRLAKRLLGLAADHKASESGDAGEIGAHLPQEELARIVGSSRESVARHLAEWQRNGWIETRYGRVRLLDADALRAIVAASEFGP